MEDSLSGLSINMPWHYDHHMGKNQDSNWGVTVEWVDKLFNTREKM